MSDLMTSEDILKMTYAGLENFLKQLLDSESFQNFLIEKNKLFPTWNDLWKVVKIWLCQYTFLDMESTIWSLVQLLPYENCIQHNLRNSLAVHDIFWNQVYLNLKEAKKRLLC